jgi:predicted nucleic acid-binding Zn ribbon protein
VTEPDGAPAPKRGADLAREALEQARQRTAARRAAEGRSSVVGRRAGSTRRRWSGPGPDARDPKPFGALAQQWVKRSGSADDLAKATVLARWAEIVGDDLASHCTPVNLVDGQLTVQAESTAWATQIKLLGPTILGKVATAVGPNVVRQIRAQGPTRPSWRFGPRHVSGRGPRDTYG